MKVKIPKTKTIGDAFNSEVFQTHLTNTNKDYLTIYDIKNNGIDCSIHTKNYGEQKWLFALEDLELYEEPFVLPEKWGVKITMETRKLVGYKLIKPEYKAAIKIITKCSEFCFNSFENEIESMLYVEELLKKAGVLDLWFEPIYEEEFKVGDWVTVIDIKGIGWLHDTSKRTFKLIGLPETFHGGKKLWKVKPGGLHASFRKATNEEINAVVNKHIKLSNGKTFHIEQGNLIVENEEIQINDIKDLYYNSNNFGNTEWKIRYNSFDIGCWKNITREDLKKIIDAYEEID